MIRIACRTGEYAVSVDDGILTLMARPGQRWHMVKVRSEESAVHWLCDHSLKKSKAKQLVAAVLRDEGPLSDPGHPLRAKYSLPEMSV